MARSQGFARGDFDTSFPIDDKFLALRHSLTPERYYAATGVYWHVAAAAWREVERKPADRIAPDAPEAIDDLISVGLLDSEKRLPNRAFLAYVGRAKRQRAATTERKRQQRTGMSRGTDRDTHVTPRESQPVTNLARVSRQGKEERDVSVTGGAGGDDDDLGPVLTHLARTRGGYVDPGTKAERELARAVDRHGGPKVMEGMDSLPPDVREGRAVVYSLLKVLDPIHTPTRNGATRGVSGVDLDEVERAFR